MFECVSSSDTAGAGGVGEDPVGAAPVTDDEEEDEPTVDAGVGESEREVVAAGMLVERESVCVTRKSARLRMGQL